MTSSAWNKLPTYGANVSTAGAEGVRQILLQNPVFSYPAFTPVERTLVISVTGASADVAETTVPLDPLISLPPNVCAIQYEILVNSTATAAGTVFHLRHKAGGADTLTVESQVVGFANYNTGVVAANSGQVTYAATKGSATAFAYGIWITGFYRSY